MAARNPHELESEGDNMRIESLFLVVAAGLLSGVTVAASPSDPSAYARSDKVGSVVVRSASDRILEFYLSGAFWQHGYLTSPGAPAACGRPAGYVRSDGVNAVVYRDCYFDIYEISLVNGGWRRPD